MSWVPVAVYSRAELALLLDAAPMHLRAARKSLPPRVGHPEFVGPLHPQSLSRYGSIRFAPDGSMFTLLPPNDTPPALAELRSGLSRQWVIERALRKLFSPVSR